MAKPDTSDGLYVIRDDDDSATPVRAFREETDGSIRIFDANGVEIAQFFDDADFLLEYSLPDFDGINTEHVPTVALEAA